MNYVMITVLRFDVIVGVNYISPTIRTIVGLEEGVRTIIASYIEMLGPIYMLAIYLNYSSGKC